MCEPDTLQDMTRDDPYRRVDDAIEAARKTYEVLRSEAIARGRKPMATWAELEPIVEAIFRIRGDVDERSRVWMVAIRKELNAQKGARHRSTELSAQGSLL